MKSLVVLFVFLGSFLMSSSSFAGTYFFARLVQNNTYLAIEMIDDHLIPPFEAGELWKIINGNDTLKFIREKELSLDCQGVTNQLGDTIGKCSLLFPYEQFKKVKGTMVFKAEGNVAARLNRYFNDSAYLSMQGNKAYLSNYNTRRLFFFGINESLIQK